MPQATPTVGRIVHYKTHGSADGVYPPTNFAAIITQVGEVDAPGQNEGVGGGLPIVNLIVFGPSGIRFEHLVEQGDAAGQWNWPEHVQPFNGGSGGSLTPRPMSPMGGPSGVGAFVGGIM